MAQPMLVRLNAVMSAITVSARAWKAKPPSQSNVVSLGPRPDRPALSARGAGFHLFGRCGGPLAGRRKICGDLSSTAMGCLRKPAVTFRMS